MVSDFNNSMPYVAQNLNFQKNQWARACFLYQALFQKPSDNFNPLPEKAFEEKLVLFFSNEAFYPRGAFGIILLCELIGLLELSDSPKNCIPRE